MGILNESRTDYTKTEFLQIIIIFVLAVIAIAYFSIKGFDKIVLTTLITIIVLVVIVNLSKSFKKIKRNPSTKRQEIREYKRGLQVRSSAEMLVFLSFLAIAIIILVIEMTINFYLKCSLAIIIAIISFFFIKRLYKVSENMVRKN